MSILHRPFGNTGESLSIIGIGGVTVVGHDAAASIRLFDEALDAGVNYADVAPSYGVDQETELRFGDALVGRRDRVFLACKTGERGADGARLELNRSLKHLQTDHIDLYQLHAITSVEEVDRAFGPDGAMEVIIKAQQFRTQEQNRADALERLAELIRSVARSSISPTSFTSGTLEQPTP